MKKNTLFPLILISSALALSACAGYYSVYGIANLFSGAVIQISMMMGLLEISKLVCSSYLFRYWNTCKVFLKTYMAIAVIVLMLITSSGIFGYLSAAYQKSEIQNKILTQKIELIDGQKSTYNNQIEQYKKRIDFNTQLRESQEKRLNEALKNDTITKNVVQLQEVQSQSSELIAKTDKDIADLTKNIQTTLDSVKSLDKDMFDLKIESYKQKDILTFQFVAEIFGTTINKVVKWLIIMLIFVFDPLAICMLLAYNSIIYTDEKPSTIPSVEAKPTETIPSLKEELPKTIEDSKFKKILKKPFGRFYGR